MNKLRNSGIDAVVTIVLLNKEKELYYIPDRASYAPYIVCRRDFYTYYNTIFGRVLSPGYYSTETKYYWESNFYYLQTKELLYTAQSKSFSLSSTELLAHEYGKMIVKDMASKGVLNKLNL